MNGLLSMIGMQTELDYLIGDFAACFGGTPLAIPKGNIPSDKQKCQPKAIPFQQITKSGFSSSDFDIFKALTA